MHKRTVFILGLLLSIFVSPALADKRVALVIGNGAYQNAPRLANPSNDGRAIAEVLRKAGFDVVEAKIDLNNADMRRTLREFTDRSRGSDMAVIYFAGHGIEIDGQNYLLPTDATLTRDSDAYDEAITLERVLQVIEPARKLRLVILDACRDNPFARTMQRTLTSRSLGRGLVGVEPGKPNTLIAFAAKAGSTAADGTGSDGNSPFTTALVKHLTTPGLDLRQAFGRVRDDVMKTTANRQEPFVYGSLGGATISLVPAAPAAAPAPSAQPSADPQAGIRKDYELALQLNNRSAWEYFLQQYPSGFYANLARVQLDKIAAEENQRVAADSARKAEAEKTRLAAEGAKAAEQAKAARDAKAAEEARVAAEKQRRAEQAKADAAERARAAAERAAADREMKEKAEAEAKSIREKAQAEAKSIRERAEADAKAAEEARKVAEKEAERLRVAALEQAKPATDTPDAEKPVQLAALPADAAKTTLSQLEVNRSLQAELRRVGCQTGAVNDDWNAAARRSLELFNRHSGMKLEAKLASLDALDAIKSRQGRICPLVCEHGFRSNGERCEKIVCRTGFRVGDNNTCEKIESRKPAAKKDSPPAGSKPVAQTTGQQQIVCPFGGSCRPVAKGCRLSSTGTGSGAVGVRGGYGVALEVCN